MDNNKWLVTLLLCLFLGEFGIHRFYNDFNRLNNDNNRKFHR